MKDAELVSHLMLLIEEGEPLGYTKDELDQIYSDYDEEWDLKNQVEVKLKEIVDIIKKIIDLDESGAIKKRFKKQGDFYALFASIYTLTEDGDRKINPMELKEKLLIFVTDYANKELRNSNEDLKNYYKFSQTGVGRATARKTRMDVLIKYLK